MRTILCVGLLAACGGGTPAKPPPPAWDRTLPDASVMGSWRGLQPARGIVHLHSPYSHDACDNMPRAADGTPNEPCLQDLRTALCVDKIDFAALTDHDASMADEDFPTLFNMRAGDVAVLDPATGDQIASRQTCDDGHQVLWSVGGENDLMPVMLHHHVPGDAAARHDTYNAVDPTAIAAFRDAGALAWIAHTEQHDLTQLRTLVPDGIEVYNLHANIAPDIRMNFLGLDPSGAIDAAANFADTTDGHPEPDLALIGFISPNQPAIDRWDQLLGDGTKMTVTAGSDAHENALPILLADGERGDSYRRVLRWFGNIALVTDPRDPAQIQAALGAGRVFAVFELFGTPEGFDVHAVTQSGGAGAVYELGAELPTGAPNPMLIVDVPHVRNLDPTLPPPEIAARILRVDATGVTELVRGSGPELTVAMDRPGAYRVEVTILPHHLGPYLGDLGTKLADVELPWIYANPIYVR